MLRSIRQPFAFSFDPLREFVDVVTRDVSPVAARECCAGDAASCGTGARAVAEVGFPMDISESNGTLVVRANLPGFRKEDVSVHLKNGVLTIEASRAEEFETHSPSAAGTVAGVGDAGRTATGARKADSAEKPGEQFYRRERYEGAVVRRLRLPVRFAETEPTAELVNGVLTLRFPESPAAKPRQVIVR
ncbi:MAG: Hsp20 family protein [Phycisphaerales bacterium]